MKLRRMAAHTCPAAWRYSRTQTDSWNPLTSALARSFMRDRASPARPTDCRQTPFDKGLDFASGEPERSLTPTCLSDELDSPASSCVPPESTEEHPRDLPDSTATVVAPRPASPSRTLSEPLILERSNPGNRSYGLRRRLSTSRATHERFASKSGSVDSTKQGEDQGRRRLEAAQRAAGFRGGECLSETYSNTLRWRCDQGHEWEAPLNNVRGGNQWCLECEQEFPNRRRRTFQQDMEALQDNIEDEQAKVDDEDSTVGSWDIGGVPINKKVFLWGNAAFAVGLGAYGVYCLLLC